MFLQAGAKINVVNRYNRNAIRYHMAYCKPGRYKHGLLLYDAVEMIGHYDVNIRGLPESFPGIFIEASVGSVPLTMCRKAIGKHLLEVDPHVSLFAKVQTLGLPRLSFYYMIFS